MTLLIIYDRISVNQLITENMKKIILFAVISLMMVGTNAFAQKKIEQKSLPEFFAGQLPGIPVALNLPFGKGEQLYVVPLAEPSQYFLKEGTLAAVFLSADAQLLKRLKSAGEADSVIVLYGVRLDPFQNWGKVQQKQAAGVLGKNGVYELKKYVWLLLSSFDVLPPEGGKKKPSKSLKELF